MLVKHFEYQVGFSYVDMGKGNMKNGSDRRSQCTRKLIILDEGWDMYTNNRG